MHFREEIKNSIPLIEEMVFEKSVAIITHDNPDPDAISSALGMKYLIGRSGAEKVDLIFPGAISHFQNRVFITKFNISYLKAKEFDKESYDILILLDTANAGSGNLNSLSFDPDIIIDHHQENCKHEPKILLLEQVGATASIVACLLRSSEKIVLSEEDKSDTDLMTALFFGILNDTHSLTKNVTPLDEEMANFCRQYLNRSKLDEVINYPLPEYVFRLEAAAFENMTPDPSNSGTLVSGIGYLEPEQRDVLPHVADRFIRMQSANTVIVFAIINNKLEASVRSSSSDRTVSDLCKEVFGPNAGGKEGMGGASVPLGFFSLNDKSSSELKDKLWEMIDSMIKEKVFKVVST